MIHDNPLWKATKNITSHCGTQLEVSQRIHTFKDSEYTLETLKITQFRIRCQYLSEENHQQLGQEYRLYSQSDQLRTVTRYEHNSLNTIHDSPLWKATRRTITDNTIFQDSEYSLETLDITILHDQRKDYQQSST